MQKYLLMFVTSYVLDYVKRNQILVASHRRCSSGAFLIKVPHGRPSREEMLTMAPGGVRIGNSTIFKYNSTT